MRNAYDEAIPIEFDLFAVRMSDGGWTVADGRGTLLSAPENLELAGWHLPVRFRTEYEAGLAINTGPDAMFDVEEGSAWTQHCIKRGASPACELFKTEYAPFNILIERELAFKRRFL